LHWLWLHQSPQRTLVALEITSLGTGTAVIVLASVSALFLMLNRQRYAATLLLVATLGGLALNVVLKLHYHRPRPHVFPWLTDVISSSFPSGHAMNGVIVYGTIAYLAARQLQQRWAHITVMLLATVIAAAISLSRIYLGVHYPSDVLGGAIIGTAWASFCMVTLTGVQRIGAPGSATGSATRPPEDA
jgi:undecaprenyl-diphosphatase